MFYSCISRLCMPWICCYKEASYSCRETTSLRSPSACVLSLKISSCKDALSAPICFRAYWKSAKTCWNSSVQLSSSLSLSRSSSCCFWIFWSLDFTLSSMLCCCCLSAFSCSISSYRAAKSVWSALSCASFPSRSAFRALT